MTSWPLDVQSDKFRLADLIIRSSAVSINYFNGINSITPVQARSIGGTINIISNTNYGFASDGIINLQNKDYALSALSTDNYKNFVPGYFKPKSFVSDIIKSMLAYGNTDNLSENDYDIVTLWPHSTNISVMITIVDSMTYSVKNLTTNTENNNLSIAEWRWIFPNRSRCTNPTTEDLSALIRINDIYRLSRLYPNNAFRWDVFRYDTIENSVPVNTLINSNILLGNSVFDISYDDIVAPGCILLSLKVDMYYFDGTSNITIPNQTIIRLGLQWIENFISVMAKCYPIIGTVKLEETVLEYGGNIIPSLYDIFNSYLGCKRLYMWKLFYDLLGVRESVYKDYSNVSGIYNCLLERNNPDLSQWDNFFILKDPKVNIYLNSIEIQSYLTPELYSNSIVSNKYGNITLLPDNKPAIECYLDNKCWLEYEDNTQEEDKKTNFTWFYVIIILYIIVIVTILIYRKFYFNDLLKSDKIT
jgi:hypothetical protein